MKIYTIWHNSLFFIVTRVPAQLLVLKCLCTTLVVFYDYTIHNIIFVEEAS